MKKLLIPVVALVLFCGCSSDDTDEQRPVITITSPTGGQSFTVGQAVNIVAEISDNDAIHGVHLHVINIASGDHLIMFEEHPDAKTYTLTKAFTAQAGVNYDITIEADDHSGNTAFAKVQVTGR